jgi:two-component system, NtrC family, sensor histidine kinase HydH
LPEMSERPRELSFLVPAFVALFLGLALLAVFFITGESRRAQILVEYESDRTAAGLLDAWRAEQAIDPSSLDQRIRGFGIYRQDGGMIFGLGDAPPSLQPREAGAAFRYDRQARTLTLTRTLGIGGPGMPHMRRGRQPMMEGGPRVRAPGFGGIAFLSMDISGFYRTRMLYGAATVLAPLLVAGLAAVFLGLVVSNLRYRRRAQEQETLARLGESARTLAHEIRNPLGAIRIQTGLLRKRLPPGGARELEVIDEETERLNVLSRRVGEFLKSPGGTREAVDLGEFLPGVARRFPWPVQVDAALPHWHVDFDRDLLRSVIENLVRNAWESYGEERSDRFVEIALSREGQRIVISVRDCGRGIPRGMQEKVFDPFYTDKIHGSGIGLPLARRFVEAAGGTLTLAQRGGGGTEARVSLPEGETP